MSLHDSQVSTPVEEQLPSIQIDRLITMQETILVQQKTILEQQVVQLESIVRLLRSAVERRDSESPATWRDNEARYRFFASISARVMQSLVYVMLCVVFKIVVADANR
jgi:hypothetical protein